MQADEDAAFRIDDAMPTADLRAILDARYARALAIDHDRPENRARVWFVAEEKLERRLDERAQEPLDAYEQPLATARDAADLDASDAAPTTAADRSHRQATPTSSSPSAPGPRRLGP